MNMTKATDMEMSARLARYTLLVPNDVVWQVRGLQVVFPAALDAAFCRAAIYRGLGGGDEKVEASLSTWHRGLDPMLIVSERNEIVVELHLTGTCPLSVKLMISERAVTAVDGEIDKTQYSVATEMRAPK